MNVLYLLLPIALFLGGAFLVGYILAARQGQYDDLETPAHRMLLEEDLPQPTLPQIKAQQVSENFKDQSKS